ncbi:MAG: phage/plasmid-related protein [Pedosphaera sp.]|nr:phage/plasmid-related protein [Pedosphaera sp.]
MSHNLLIQNGEASMFYVEEVPWHGLGTKLDKPATAEEAITAAKLDWEVVKLPLYAGAARIKVPDRYAVVRKDGLIVDTKSPILGVVSKEYTPLQNHEAFGFFDPIVGQEAAIYHTAGALGQGERVWILAKLPSTMRVVGDDISEKYLLLCNSHDGKSAVQIKFTLVRVVCQNTLTLAMNDGPVWRVFHHQDIHERLKEANQMLGLIDTQFNTMEESFQAMARVPMDANRLTEYLKEVYPDSEDPIKQPMAERDRTWSQYFFDQGKGNRMPGVEGTLWAGFCGVTEWLDHHQTRQKQDQRLSSAWVGAAYRMKARAYSIAEEKLAEWLD